MSYPEWQHAVRIVGFATGVNFGVWVEFHDGSRYHYPVAWPWPDILPPLSSKRLGQAVSDSLTHFRASYQRVYTFPQFEWHYVWTGPTTYYVPVGVTPVYV